MIKGFVGGDIGCARLAFSDKSLHLFPQSRELFPVIPAGQGGRPKRECEALKPDFAFCHKLQPLAFSLQPFCMG
jgi:hypothetical protein